MRNPNIDRIRDEQIARIRAEKRQKRKIPKELIKEDEKYKDVSHYDYRSADGGYVDVFDMDTGEFMFSDDTKAAAMEFIRKHPLLEV